MEDLDAEVWVGGPVAPNAGWVLFDPTSFDSREVEAVHSPPIAVSAARLRAALA